MAGISIPTEGVRADESGTGSERSGGWDLDDLGVVYDEYSGPVTAVVGAIVGDPARIDEGAVRTFASAWQSHRDAERFDPDDDLLALARRVAVAMTTEVNPDHRPAEPLMLPGSAQTSEIWQVRTSIEELSDSEALVLRMEHLEKIGHSEIARRLESDIASVKSRSYGAHHALVRMLEPTVIARALEAEAQADRAAIDDQANGSTGPEESIDLGLVDPPATDSNPEVEPEHGEGREDSEQAEEAGQDGTPAISGDREASLVWYLSGHADGSDLAGAEREAVQRIRRHLARPSMWMRPSRGLRSELLAGLEAVMTPSSNGAADEIELDEVIADEEIAEFTATGLAGTGLTDTDSTDLEVIDLDSDSEVDDAEIDKTDLADADLVGVEVDELDGADLASADLDRADLDAEHADLDSEIGDDEATEGARPSIGGFELPEWSEVSARLGEGASMVGSKLGTLVDRVSGPGNWPMVVAGAALVILIGFAAAGFGGRDEATPDEPIDSWEVELEAVNAESGDTASATVEVRPTGSGLALTVTPTGLDAPPPGGYYAVWLQTVDGTRTVPVGSFSWRDGGEPVELTSGVDPAPFSEMIITLQPEPSGDSGLQPGRVVYSGSITRPLFD